MRSPGPDFATCLPAGDLRYPNTAPSKPAVVGRSRCFHCSQRATGCTAPPQRCSQRNVALRHQSLTTSRACQLLPYSEIIRSIYAILRRLKTGILAKSKMKAKTAAATRVPPTTNIGRGAIAIPQIARVEPIRRSTTDDPMSHRLGRHDPIRLRSRFG
jgi:hypothetical protein